MAKRKSEHEEGPPTESPLIWRLDPFESLSDWKIEIVSDAVAKEGGTEPTKVDVYHVHKAILAAGCRKSEYFATLFHQNGFSETQTSTSRIELHSFSAKVVPDLLDYIYDGRSALQISTKNATALHWLGQYFEIRRLTWDVQQFVAKDLTASTCGTYYEHAWVLQDEKILQDAEKMCRDKILQIKTSSRLLHVPDSQFWINLLEGAQITDRFSLKISRLLAMLFSNVDFDKTTFQKLTGEKFMPVVHSSAALKLIELDQKKLSNESETLSSLQQRCVATLSDRWSDLYGEDATRLGRLAKLSPLVLAELLNQSILKCHEKSTTA